MGVRECVEKKCASALDQDEVVRWRGYLSDRCWAQEPVFCEERTWRKEEFEAWKAGEGDGEGGPEGGAGRLEVGLSGWAVFAAGVAALL